LNGFQAVLRGLHLIVPSAEIQRDHTSEVCFIIDDENLGSHPLPHDAC
jgi:hypothetical protein